MIKRIIPIALLAIVLLATSCSKMEEAVESAIETITEAVEELGSNAKLNALKDSTYYVHQEINLTSFVTADNGYKVSKVEILDNGVKTAISDASSHKFDKWGLYTLVYTVSKSGSKDEEVTLENFKVNPLVWSAFQIDDADNAVHDYNFRGNEATTDYQSDIEIAKSVGLFDLESLILEAIANGTATLKASEVKSRLARNRILWVNECPSPNMDEYSIFEKIPGAFEDGDSGTHAWVVSKIFLMGTKEVISKLGTKVLYCNDFLIYNTDNPIPYVKSHPDWIFHTVNTCTLIWGFQTGTYDELLKKISSESIILDRYKTFFGTLDNIYFACSALGNVTSSSTIRQVVTLDEIKSGQHGSWNVELEYGADAIMGSNNYTAPAYVDGTYLIYNSQTLHTTKENLNNEHVWMDHTYANPNTHATATSYATPSSCGKAYLMTCAQLLVNPELTKAQARKFVRETAFDGTLNSMEGDENGHMTSKGFYGNAKVMNPAGAFPLFYSTFPTTIDHASTELIPITHGVHKNSVVVGPGVVDKDGNAVTKENYTQMIGKDLYIDPTKLYDYGYEAGSTCEFVEYLCVDGKGSGAMDRASEAYKSIVSHAVSVTIN